MKRFYLFFKTFLCCVAFILISEAIWAQHAQTKNSSTAQSVNNYKCKIIDGGSKTFGYDIYGNGRLVIHQPSIPALGGNEGFKTRTRADKVAQLVIKKIKNGEMPPTISIQEMKMLKAL